MNLKKILLGSLAVVAAAVSLAPATHAALNDAEFTSALNWAYENGLTKYNTEDAFNPYANITREQASKFFASYTVTNLCEVASDEDAVCDFSDLNSGDSSLKEFIMLSCELGLVKGSGGKFNPTANLTRAEAFTILSRAMSANAGEDAPAEDGTPWYAGHFKAMQDAGVTKETNVEAQTRPITRYELLLVLYRSKMDDAECSDTDVNDLLDELFGDDTTDDEDTTDDVVTESNGTAMAKLSSATPNGATLPGGVSAKVASFTFTASSEDVVLQSIDVKRTGLGDDDIVAKLTLFANGDVVSKSKSENSDDVFQFVLNPAVTVKAGQSVTVDAVAKVGNSSGYSNQEFALSLMDFGTNGKEDKSNLMVTANTFRVAGVQGSVVTVENDGSLSNPNLGDKDVELMKFKLKGDNSNDVEITQVTIVDQKKNADDNLSNIKLLHKGNVVATTAKANGKYVTFTLSTPVKIESGKTEKFSVTADVIAGAGDPIEFDIDQAIYVLGNDLKFGYGIAVTDPVNFNEQELIILAGEVTLSENNLVVDKVRFDRDNVVLASFDLISKAGKSLSLEDIKFKLNDTTTTGTLYTIFENVELEVTINGSTRTYDLDRTGNFYFDTDMGISLPDGATVKVNLVADIANQSTVAQYIGSDFNFILDTNSGFEIIELEDDTVVDDVTPNQIDFDTVDVVNSNVTVSRLFLGDVDVVRGSKLIDAYKFEVKTDNVSAVILNDITFNGSVVSNCPAYTGGSTLTKDLVTQFQLHRATNGGWTLVDSESASKLSAGALQFTNLNQEIAASTTQQYLLTVDIAGSDSLDGCEFRIARGAVDIEDDDSYLIDVATDTNPSRIISIQGAGTVSAAVDTIDSKVSSEKHVIGGTTSDWVASFDVTATNEAMDLIDVTVLVSGDIAKFNANVTEVILYNEAGTELARKGVTSATEIEFTDLTNVVLNQGNTTMYVKVITNGIGLNQGTTSVMGDTQLALQIIEARGKSSGKKVGATATAYSKLFDVIPAKISDIEFVSSFGGSSVITSFGANGATAANIAILKVVTDNWTNLTTTGTSLDVVLDQIQFTFPAGVTNATIQRLGNGTVTPIAMAAGLADFTAVDANSSIAKSTTAYYLVKADIASGTASFSPSINGLDTGSFVYKTNDNAYGTVNKLLIGDAFINATQINYQN